MNKISKVRIVLLKEAAMVRSNGVWLAIGLACVIAFSIALSSSCHGDHECCPDEGADDDVGDDDAVDDDAGDNNDPADIFNTSPMVCNEFSIDDSIRWTAPHVLDTSNSSCKDDEQPQSIEFDYADGVLTVTHVNGVFNCCLDSIEVTMQMEGGTIDLYEQEITPNPCFCVCPFDVTTRIEGLASGSYTVNIFANGYFAVSGQVEIP